MSSDAGPMWGQLILLLVLILVNAYFAAAEIAIVSLNKNRVRSLAQAVSYTHLDVYKRQQ